MVATSTSTSTRDLRFGEALAFDRGLSLYVGSRTWVRPAVTAAALGLFTLISRAIAPARYLFNWDSIQFALGLQRFDLAAHRPHPPGYLGYLVLGRMTSAMFGGDAQAGLVALSIAAEVGTVVVLYLMARRLWDEFAGVAAAALLATSPLFWIYGKTALTYPLEALLVLTTFWLCLEASRSRRGALVAAALSAAAAGAIRPTTEAFLLPVLAVAVVMAWRTERSRIARSLGTATAALAVGTAAWVVPLMAMSGGLHEYMRVSKELGDHVTAASAVWSGGVRALAFNTDAVIEGIGAGLGVFLPFAVAAVIAGWVTRATPAESWDRALLPLAAALAIPSLLVYAAVHIGQLGYVLMFLPLLLLPAGPLVRRLTNVLQPRLRPGAKGMVIAGCALFNLAIFLVPSGALAAQLSDRDKYGDALIAMVSAHDPATTVIVTEPEASGAYRMAEYYLPAYTTVALGIDRHERAGEMFTTAAPGPEYDLARFQHAGKVVLPAAAREALILDRAVVGLIGDRSRITTHRFGPHNSWRYWTVALDPADAAVAAGDWVYLRGSDCPCRGAGATRVAIGRVLAPR